MFHLMIHWLHINQSCLWKMSRITAMTNRFPSWQSPLPFQCTHQRNPIPLQPQRPHSLVTVISTLLSLNHVIKSLALEECAWNLCSTLVSKLSFLFQQSSGCMSTKLYNCYMSNLFLLLVMLQFCMIFAILLLLPHSKMTWHFLPDRIN